MIEIAGCNQHATAIIIQLCASLSTTVWRVFTVAGLTSAMNFFNGISCNSGALRLPSIEKQTNK